MTTRDELVRALSQAGTSFAHAAQFVELLEERLNALEAEFDDGPTVDYRLDPNVWPLTTSAPAYKTDGAAGADIVAAESVTIAPGRQHAVRTGLYLAVPLGWEAQVRPRSGFAMKDQVSITNSPGTIDSDYRGEVLALLENRGSVDFKVKRGDRVAQLVFARARQAVFRQVIELSSTTRGSGGWGSTGR